MSPVRAVLFDYVHTLADSGYVPALQFSFLGVLRRRLVREFPARRQELSFVAWQVLYHVNSSYSGSYRRGQLEELDIRALFAEAFARQGLSIRDGLLDDIVALNHSTYAERLAIPPATLDTLRQLKERGLRLGIVSNNMFQRRWMGSFPLLFSRDGLLDGVVLSSDVGQRKPGAKIYREALARLGVGAADTIFVGDRLAEDVRAPKALGMPRAFLTYEFRQEPDPRCEADGILRRLPDLLPYLAG